MREVGLVVPAEYTARDSEISEQQKNYILSYEKKRGMLVNFRLLKRTTVSDKILPFLIIASQITAPLICGIFLRIGARTPRGRRRLFRLLSSEGGTILSRGANSDKYGNRRNLNQSECSNHLNKVQK